MLALELRFGREREIIMGNRDERDRQYIAERKERRRRKRRRALICKTVILLVLLVILAVCLIVAIKGGKKNKEPENTINPTATPVDGETSEEAAGGESGSDDTDIPAASGDAASVMAQAERMAAGYDYDGAIELLQTIPGFDSDEAVVSAIADYQAKKNACVAVNVDTVPHIFYHSLINDTDRAFNVSVLGQSTVDGLNAWMTTVEEFDKITQQMYDNGYVFVRLRDLVVETTDEQGNVHFEKNTNLLLPPDKKPVVLSIDDLSYYHSPYEAAGYPNKLVLDENGNVKCEYTDASGNTTIGDYDVVPRLNSFLEAHPDGAYKGARGLIAMTGYNGVFGYRTDVAYKTGVDLDPDQKAWLDKHPDFNWDNEVAEATKIADAIKKSGWEFASHTWGHLSVTNKTAAELAVDNEKWVNTVENIVGDVDTIIFAHGNDIGDWRDYSADNEKYNYYKSAGYNFFCNVDGSTPYWVQIRGDYVRQGRINLDGFMLYRSTQGETDVLNGMFNASEVFDSRRPTPVTANGKA